MGKQRYISIILLMAVIFTFGSFAAGDNAYSMENDPLVTLSYVQDMEQRIVDQLYRKIDPDAYSAYLKSTGFTFEQLSKGQQIVATGTCELVLRAGTGVVVITGEANLRNKIGFSDLTAAKEVPNGSAVETNHLLLASAGDGRLITVTSDVAYFMVRGDYTVVG